MAAVVMTALTTAMLEPVWAEDRQSALGPITILGDAIPEPLSGRPGDPRRGLRIIVDREAGNCLACHQVPAPDEPFQGDLGPNLAGVAKRLTAGQIRLRLADQSRINPETLMPPYYRITGLTGVAAKYQGRPVLTAEEIEDVVAYLTTLRQ